MKSLFFRLKHVDAQTASRIPSHHWFWLLNYQNRLFIRHLILLKFLIVLLKTFQF